MTSTEGRSAECVLGPRACRLLEELMRLHDEAFEHWMKIDPCHKSSEGAVTLQLTNTFERQDGEPPLRIKGVEVFAYVVGPNRHHYFDSLEEALRAVTKWHRETMKVDPEERLREEAEAWAAVLNDGEAP